MNQPEKIAHAYFFAKKYLIKKGYGNEIDWHDAIDYSNLTEEKFLKEVTWVIIASGLSDNTVRAVYPKIKKVLFNLDDASILSSCESILKPQALLIFNHSGKIDAIFSIAGKVAKEGFNQLKQDIKEKGISYIKSFPYMGDATAYHLAKNLGLNVVKPDRHLQRISKAFGFTTPDELCEVLSNRIEEKVSVIDLIIWRYATLDKNYLRTIQWFRNRSNA